MLSFIHNLLLKIQTPWIRYAVEAGAVVVLGITFFALLNQVQSCNYSRGREKQKAEDQKLKTEYDQLAGENKELKKQIAEIEPQLIAYKSAAEAGKKVDAGLAQKIEDVGKESANAEANAQVSIPCVTRAQRVCDLFRASDKRFDCKPIFDECAR